jgi:hypothetical protein
MHLSPNVPYFTQLWFWKMPLIKEAAGVDQVAKDEYGALLEKAANPEFNNPGGFLLPLSDYGTIGGLVYWFLFGAAVAWIYQSFKKYELLGLLLYPMVFLGLVEVPRVLYLSDGRFFPSFVMLALAVFLCSRASHRVRSGNVAGAHALDSIKYDRLSRYVSTQMPRP